MLRFRPTRRNVVTGLALLCLCLLCVANFGRPLLTWYWPSHGLPHAVTEPRSHELPHAVTETRSHELPALNLSGLENSSLCCVHQSWRDRTLPGRFLRWFASWDACFPDYHHLLWTDADNLRLVKQRSPSLLPQYVAYEHPIQRADAARYLYMYHYGGVYTDLDNECLRSFRHLIERPDCGVILGSMRVSSSKEQYIQNSFMYSRRGHPFWLQVLAVMQNRSKITGVDAQETINLTTGPRLLMHAVAEFARAYEGSANPGPVCVFPDTYFNPYSWEMDRSGPCKDLNRMSELDLALCKIRHKRAYVIQYHTQSWLAGRV